MTYNLANKRIWVAGHRGMVGGAIVRRLASENCEILMAGRDQVDLTDQAAVRTWMRAHRPDGIFLAAAKVGGIHANNTMPADFLFENLAIEINVIRSAYEVGAEKLLFLGSSCIYPKFAPQPIVEESLLTGVLEPTNEAYAIAKIAGIKLCQAMRTQYKCDFISAQPTNLYGPGDNYNLETSHVLPALLRKFHDARKTGSQTVTLWGTGSPLREFLYVDDLADALVFLFKTYSGDIPINIGSQEEITIRDLAYLIAEVVGYKAELIFDAAKPDGTPRKLMDSRRLHEMGWNATRGLREGIEAAYKDYVANYGE